MSVKSRLTGRWDPRDYARQVDGVWVITPSTFYPAMIKRIHATLDDPGLPQELVDKVPHPEIDPGLAARRYRNWARRVEGTAWADAQVSLLAVRSMERIEARAEALECARLWFTRALKNLSGEPVRIHIERDNNFRLGTTRQFAL